MASASGAGDAVATKLDDKNGFAGASFGQAPRAFRGLKAADKKGERVTFHVPAGAVYAGAPLNHLDYTFTKNKLGVIAFTVKNSADCKTVRAALERELGAPQKAIAAPESALWKGAKVALRFSGGVTCGGTVASHDLAGSDYTALDN